VAELI